MRHSANGLRPVLACPDVAVMHELADKPAADVVAQHELRGNVAHEDGVAASGRPQCA